MQPPSSGSRPSGCRVVSNANTTDASSAREAPANIAAMPTSAAMRGSMPERGNAARGSRAEQRAERRRRW